ncbi:MAG TPA: PEPxxWA-CTERM sorting domain-containing protein [Phenylobacterium sp.]
MGIRSFWAATVLACGLGATAAPASATIYDIAATNGVGVDVTFGAGQTYLIEWIGMADGGAYDSANGNCPTGDCSSGWNNGLFALEIPNNPANFDLDIVSIPGAVALPGFSVASFSSAADALAAYKTGANINDWFVNIVGGVPVGGVVFERTFPNPFRIMADGGVNRFLVADFDQDRSNNFGGVSLRITAVPEPATWAMLVLGFGGAGAMLRRRGRLAAA